MSLLRKMMVLLLLALWLPSSSHTFLEALDIIHPHTHDLAAEHAHEDGHEHDEADRHEAADGMVRAQRMDENTPAAPLQFVLLSDANILSDLVRAVAEQQILIEAPSTVPPELQPRWQFIVRAAPPVRAPSFV